MESFEGSMRLRLILGKFQIRRAEVGALGATAIVDFGSGVIMRIDIPVSADVRDGDWLTFYTEVPYAQPSTTPKQ